MNNEPVAWIGKNELQFEEEKQLVIKRHEQREKYLRKNWEGKKVEIVGNFFAIKTEKAQEK